MLKLIELPAMKSSSQVSPTRASWLPSMPANNTPAFPRVQGCYRMAAGFTELELQVSTERQNGLCGGRAGEEGRGRHTGGKNTACGRNEEKSNREKLSQQQPGKTHRANTFLEMLFFHWKEPELLLGAKKLQNKLRISYLVPESKEVITEWWGHVTKTQNQTKWLLLAKHSTIWGSK